MYVLNDECGPCSLLNVNRARDNSTVLNLVRELLSKKLLAQLPEPLRLNGVCGPSFDGVLPRVGGVAIHQVRAIVSCRWGQHATPQ